MTNENYRESSTVKKTKTCKKWITYGEKRPVRSFMASFGTLVKSYERGVANIATQRGGSIEGTHDVLFGTFGESRGSIVGYPMGMHLYNVTEKIRKAYLVELV